MRVIGEVRFLTPVELMRTLGVTRAQLLSLVRRAKLKATWFKGRMYVAEPELVRFLQDETQQPAQQVATRLLRAMNVRTRVILSSKNGKERG